jgi:hypothetical protein
LAPGGGVRCVLVNERGAEQRMAPLLERRGVVVIKLLDQVVTKFTRFGFISLFVTPFAPLVEGLSRMIGTFLSFRPFIFSTKYSLNMWRH